MTGRMFAIVGPSGVGKDTLMMKVAQHYPDLYLVRRVITRPEAAGGENFDGVTEEDFAQSKADGAFALSWQAHGLSYGIPVSARDVLAQGRDVMFNGSRAMLSQAAAEFPELRVLYITARPDVLAQRLTARGRETPEQISKRLERATQPLPQGLRVTTIDNSGPLRLAVEALVAALQPESV